ncbi:hypothetical protein KR032_009137 [Drosophila birchii]|nr:hypothetical protein KR032_009137 [Drosophila birchii]
MASATAVQRNPFRGPVKRVRFQGLGRASSKQNPSLCSSVNSVSHSAEEPGPSPQEPESQEFTRFDTLTGVSHIAEHRIIMRNDRPLKQRYFPRNPAMRVIIDKQIDELLQEGRLEPSKSPHSVPIVITGKNNGDVRMCVDYPQLNKNSVMDAYPLPRIHQFLKRLRNAKYISTLDFKNGYWQIPMVPSAGHGHRIRYGAPRVCIFARRQLKGSISAPAQREPAPEQREVSLLPTPHRIPGARH